MTANAVPTAGTYPLRHNKREAKVIETARSGLQTASLANGKILVGNASGVAAAVTPSGDVTISNAGVAAIGAAKILKSMLSANVAADWKVAVAASGVTGSTVIGVLINDICLKIDTVGGTCLS